MTGDEVLFASILESRLPGCLAKLRALEHYTDGKPWEACKHVVDGVDGMVCVQHPAAGVHCTKCIPHHIRRHGPEAEFGCDECGSVVETIHGLAIEAQAARLVVRDTRGRRRPMLGRLWLVALGACPPCWGGSHRSAA